MYNLNIHIESEDLFWLKEVQQALSTVFNSDDKVHRYSFNHEERGGGRRDSRGVTAPPPPAHHGRYPKVRYSQLTDIQRKAYADLLESELMVGEVKEKLMEYINEWEEYKEKRNGDFIEEEEMKL